MRNIVLTGGTRGIGKAILEKFAENGDNIACIYANSEQIAQEIEQKHSNVSCYKCDISCEKSVTQTAEKILAKFDRIDVVINNASISRYGLFTDTNSADFDEIFAVNVKGTYNITHAFAKNMLENQSGSVINISSMWGEVGASMEVLYSATKGAVIAFTKALAKEFGLSNIRVNCITPGVIKTDMLSEIDQETIDFLKEETPLNRIGMPVDVANMVYFLASQDASFITGQIIGVNGGFVI